MEAFSNILLKFDLSVLKVLQVFVEGFLLYVRQSLICNNFVKRLYGFLFLSYP